MRSYDAKMIEVKLVRGLSGRSETQRRTLASLGLRKIGQVRVHQNVNTVLGQVNKVINFVEVKPAN
jgi:large subunit ribosomal protein L30